ncbi:MAG: spermidine/putrescine transport system ATP-binding protein [Actinomycetota bacterium]|nr:spermidine/putrescine transport system ATP-binding protein [Actinomycetota bacterium]
MTLKGSASLELEGISKSFGSVRAVDHVSLTVRPGEFYALLGPSGCGKTTTLRLVAGFEQPDEGRIVLADEEITRMAPNKRRVNTVFQHYALFPHLTVEGNVAYGLRHDGLDKTTKAERLEEALATVRLKELRERYPRELSGGQQQRVALARALVKQPQVLLLDEPLAALDLKLRKAMQVQLKSLQESVGITFVYVTHDQEEALTLSDRIAVMSDGKLLQEGTPDEIYERPRSRFVADFIGQSNFLGGSVESANGRVAVKETSTGATLLCAPNPDVKPGDPVTVAIRPEKIYPVGDQTSSNVVQGRLMSTSYLGSFVQYRIQVGQHDLVMQRQSDVDDPARSWAVGDSVSVGWNEDSALVLTDDHEVAGEEDRRLLEVTEHSGL